MSVVKGPLEYISDLELPDEQLIEITASDGEAQLNEGSDASLSNSVIAQEVSSYYISKYLIDKHITFTFLGFGCSTANLPPINTFMTNT